VTDVLNVAGSVASIGSALGAAWFWWKARGEAKRAERLVRGAQRRQLVEDLTRLCGTVQLVAAALTPEEPGAARQLAEQLSTETIALSARHAGDAPVGLRRSLLEARYGTRELARSLSEPAGTGTGRRAELQPLIEACRNSLEDARGRSLSAIDQADAGEA
jgi:hypothetical protein